MLKKPTLCWVSERPTFPPEAKWTPEEDEKLLELEEKFHGRWEDIPNEISHTPYECDVRCLELRQQMLRAKMQQHKGPVSRSASQLVSEAHKEVGNSASESDFPQLGTEAHKEAGNSASKSDFPQLGTVAAANSAAPEIDIATAISLKNTLESVFNRRASQLVSKAHKEAVNSLSGSSSAQLGIVAADNSALRAAREIKEIDAAMIISVRNILGSVFNISIDDQVDDPAIIKFRESEAKAVELSKERDQLVKQKVSAIQEAHLWRIELEKARYRVAFLEAAVRGAEERARNAEIDAEAKDMELREAATLTDKQLLLAYINAVQAQVQRSIKHDHEWSDKNLDKPAKRLKISSSSEEGLHLWGQGSIHPTTDDAQWKGNQATLDDLPATDD